MSGGGGFWRELAHTNNFQEISIFGILESFREEVSDVEISTDVHMSIGVVASERIVALSSNECRYALSVVM